MFAAAILTCTCFIVLGAVRQHLQSHVITVNVSIAMWVLPILGYLGLIFGFLFLTLAIASGLYYLSELVEEHSVLTKKLLARTIYGVVGLQILLLAIDRLPVIPSLLSIASHGIYLQNLRRFPWVKLSDPIFILSCTLVLVNHFVWFSHFSKAPEPPLRYNYYDPPKVPSFTEVASFFGLQVWLVPFALFISLSAGENVLPSMGSEYATGSGSSFARPGLEPGPDKRKGLMSREGLLKTVINTVREKVGESGELLGLWKGERTRPL